MYKARANNMDLVDGSQTLQQHMKCGLQSVGKPHAARQRNIYGSALTSMTGMAIQQVRYVSSQAQAGNSD